LKILIAVRACRRILALAFYFPLIAAYFSADNLAGFF
jgi:hypothetical protein